MRFIKGCGFETKITKNSSASECAKNVCTAINVTNPLISLTGESLTYEDSDYLESLNQAYYIAQANGFIQKYSNDIIEAINLKLIHPNQLPNLRPTTLADAKESVDTIRSILASVPNKLIELLMPHVHNAKKDLIAGGIPSEVIEEFEEKFSPEFDFSYINNELVLETPTIEGCLVVSIDSFRGNSKAASALVSMLCQQGSLFDEGYNASYYNHMQAGGVITDTKTVGRINKLLSSKLDLDELEQQIAWVKLALPLLADIEKNYDHEISESLMMNFDALDSERLLACDENYVDEFANSRLESDINMEELVVHIHRMLTTMASFSYLASRFKDPQLFSKLNNKKSSSGKMLAAIYEVASNAVDNTYLEIANEDHIGLRTFVLPEFLNQNNEDAYTAIDDVYNHAYEVDELTLTYQMSLNESHITAVKNLLINSYCMNLLGFLSERPKHFCF
ncbi:MULTISPECIES: hypothetical protein [unclassified Pseudoalteromonas]|uniref:hypothetical protein n=1 Tax=unclassified Pseudoalteromonas TaxID=194690 RepID=UPI0023582FF8|nr:MULTISPECIES: hypothetical protein [unclassified Pseudoalteromonas]MDC9563440.1 hypothetical protein [Pseudoalteromonas sp. GAB2316C]MDC9572078.1 hypothetical protein [Pseudoalteromonas sp. GABNS16A]MDC9583887.1 hypothetical protein [Pseudoalteromonas sp. GABNS16C]MDC9607844.1 hypothetical protein [Pseudoalteromonas sp. GABNS16H]